MFKVKSYTATLAVSDIDQAKEFYTTQLGCEIINEDDNGVALGVPGSPRSTLNKMEIKYWRWQVVNTWVQLIHNIFSQNSHGSQV